MHVQSSTFVRLRCKLQQCEWYSEVHIYHGLRLLMERVEEKLLQGYSRWFLLFKRCWTLTDVAFGLLSLWTVEFGESFCTRASTAYDLCCETFPGDTYLVPSYWTKKSHPIVNCSSPRDQLEVNDNSASERRAIEFEDHDGKLTDICVLCGGKIII